ncbi:MAG: ABC transporter permease, partial [Acidimicrobiales bacterium]
MFVRSEFRFKRFLESLTFIPFVMPTVVVASAFISVNELLTLDGTPLSLQGSALGIIVAHIFFNTSIVVRTLTSTWPMIDFESEQAAQTLGASKFRIFFQITLPQLKPGLMSAASLAFLFTFTSFGVILILGGLGKATVETEIWRYATQRTEFEAAAVLGIVQLLVVVAMLTINNKFLTTDSRNTNLRSKVRYMHPVSKLRKAANTAFILGFFGLPFVVLLER